MKSDNHQETTNSRDIESGGKMKYTGINHLALVTGDMDKTIRFWRDLLGLRLIVGMGKPGYKHYFFELSDNDMIAFFEWPEVEKIEEKDHGFPVKGPVVFDHVSLGVESEEELREIKSRLEVAGFWISEIIDHGFIYSLYSFDPNGIAIEFSCYTQQIDVRKHPTMIDKAPSDAAMEGPDPQPHTWPKPTKLSADEEQTRYPGEGKEIIEKQSINKYKNKYK